MEKEKAVVDVDKKENDIEEMSIIEKRVLRLLNNQIRSLKKSKKVAK